MKVIVTGIAGFIGHHAARALLAAGHTVVGVDNLSAYYAVQLKRDRLAELARFRPFEFDELDVGDLAAMSALFTRHADATHVVHLAAQAGVRYSLEHPASYVHANVDGPAWGCSRPCRDCTTSSMSCMRARPRSTAPTQDDILGRDQRVSHPVSPLRGEQARHGEHIAETYGHLLSHPIDGLSLLYRLRSLGAAGYGLLEFARQIVAGESIAVYNNGDMARDFTYVDDVVAGLMGALNKPPRPNDFGSPHRVYNLGNHRPVPLLNFIALLEQALGRRAQMCFEPMQQGDVKETFADISQSKERFRLRPADDHRSRHSALRRLVQGLSQREIDFFLSPSCRRHASGMAGRGNNAS